MPDDYGNLRPISVPLIPWLQTFDRGAAVRFVSPPDLAGQTGIVVEQRPEPHMVGGQCVAVLLDDDDSELPVITVPGTLRARSARENQSP